MKFSKVSCKKSLRITTVFVDTRLWKTKHPWKRFQNFRQSCVLSTDRIKIHQSQPLVRPYDLLYVMLVLVVFLQLESVRYQQTQPLAYMSYIYSVPSLQCIVLCYFYAIFWSFVSRERHFWHVLAHISRDKSETGAE